MKKHGFKALAMGLVAIMAVGVFASCTGSTPSGTNTSTPEPANSGTDPAASVTPAEGFTFFGFSSGVSTEELNAYPLVEMLEAHTGYKVTYDQAPTGNDEAQTAINNIFLNREDYQVIIVGKDHFYSLLAQDALKDLSPYINETENLKDSISQFGWDTASKDGGIYAIPRKDAIMVTNWAIAYRADWLEEYNAANPGSEIPVPDEANGYSMSTGDFKTLLEFYKTKVPQGGAAFHVDVNSVVQENIMPAFGIYNEWSDVNGELTYYINHPGFGDYLAYMQDLFDAGLVTYSATADDPTNVKMLQAAQLGAGRVFHWDAATIEGAEGTDDTIGYISALVADEDKGDASAVRKFAAEAYQFFSVVPKYATDEQAAAVVDWADKCVEPDFFRSLVLGEEGETYTVQDGAYYPILPAFNDERGLSDRFLVAVREESYGDYWLCRTRKTEAQDKLFSRANYQILTTGVKSPIAVMPPNDVYDNLFSGAKAELTTALVTTMFSTSRMTVEQLQQVYSANNGAEVDEAVNEWYAGWTGKSAYNTVQ